MLSGGIDALAPEQLEDAEWRRRDEGRVALRQAPGVVGMEPVDIFMWRDLLEGLVGIETIRQGHLDQDSVDGGISRQLSDARLQLPLADVVQMLDRRLEADLFGGSLLAAHIGRRGAVIAYLDDGDARTALVRMPFDGELQLIANGARVGAAVDQPGRHRLSLPRQIADLDRPRDLHREAVEVRQRRPLADPA